MSNTCCVSIAMSDINMFKDSGRVSQRSSMFLVLCQTWCIQVQINYINKVILTVLVNLLKTEVNPTHPLIWKRFYWGKIICKLTELALWKKDPHISLVTLVSFSVLGCLWECFLCLSSFESQRLQRATEPCSQFVLTYSILLRLIVGNRAPQHSDQLTAASRCGRNNQC